MAFELPPQALAEANREMRAPSWAKMFHEHRVADETIAAWRREAEEVDAANKLVVERFSVRLSAFIAEANAMLPKAGRNAVAKHRPYIACRNWVAALDEQIRRWGTEDKKRADEVRAREADAERIALAVRAVEWLRARGKVAGVDYEPAQAVEFANDIAADEEQKKVVGDGLIRFGGDDNCEGCGGWDGESRRCQCGNRRVSWERDSSHTFEKPCVYAEAY